MKNLKINYVDSIIPYCEAKGLSKVFDAYAEYCSSEEIMEIGFNQYSGYVYIHLENSICICSMLGQDVEYFSYNNENDNEMVADTYDEAIDNLNKN
jgi:hypothetical protein